MMWHVGSNWYESRGTRKARGNVYHCVGSQAERVDELGTYTHNPLQLYSSSSSIPTTEPISYYGLPVALSSQRELSRGPYSWFTKKMY